MEAEITLTPTSSLPVGFNCLIVQAGSNAVTIGTSGTTVHNRSSHVKTAGQWAIMTIVCVSANVFVSSGDGATS